MSTGFGEDPPVPQIMDGSRDCSLLGLRALRLGDTNLLRTGVLIFLTRLWLRGTLVPESEVLSARPGRRG